LGGFCPENTGPRRPILPFTDPSRSTTANVAVDIEPNRNSHLPTETVVAKTATAPAVPSIAATETEDRAAFPEHCRQQSNHDSIMTTPNSAICITSPWRTQPSRMARHDSARDDTAPTRARSFASGGNLTSRYAKLEKAHLVGARMSAKQDVKNLSGETVSPVVVLANLSKPNFVVPAICPGLGHQTPVITVTGKSVLDVGHSKIRDQTRRSHLSGYAALEIPGMYWGSLAIPACIL
jgi:hypothetical protein